VVVSGKGLDRNEDQSDIISVVESFVRKRPGFIRKIS
jgi:hypothetical protein